MFCTNCGVKVIEGSAHCTSCGTRVDAAAPDASSYETGYNSGDSSIPKGCLVLIVSFFTMPIKTAHVAANQLRQIGRTGTVETTDDFPHLSWVSAVLPTLATIASILFILYGFSNLFSDSYRPFAERIGLFVGSFFVALLLDWLIMWGGEGLSIYVVSAKYYSKKLREEEK